MNKHPFVVTVGGNFIAERRGFYQAFDCFFSVIDFNLKRGSTHEWLLTTNFITHKVKTSHGLIECHLDYFQVCKLAYKIGALKDGKLQPASGCDQSKFLIDSFFLRALARNFKG